MADTFGARVRKHREQQGISLETIAQQTKIKTSLLEGLERGDVSQWPSGIFRRGYARAYAEAIGLNPDEVTREFVALYPDPEIALPSPPAPQPTRVRRLIDSAFGSFSRRRPAEEPAPEMLPAPPPSAEAAQPQAAAPPARPHAAPAAKPLALVPPPQAPSPAEKVAPAAAAPAPAARVSEKTPNLLAAAKLCTDIGRVKSSGELVPLLRDAMKLLGARGLIVWIWDAAAEELRPSIVHGYSEKVRARLRPVKRDADNATAEAFRLLETRAVAGRDNGRSALAVPLLSGAGCPGVLAIELPQERAEVPAVQAVAAFMAAVLAQLIGGSENSDARPEGAGSASMRSESASAV